MPKETNAFTLIEVIFVIVMIGILTAIALPRLAATRGDSIDARDCKNIAVCVTDIAAAYTAKESADKNASPACVAAESSMKNPISITLSGASVTVGGAPSSCSWLNGTTVFGGSRVSTD